MKIFNNIESNEANDREAAMIEAVNPNLGKGQAKNLTNDANGSYYAMSSWNYHEKRELGAYNIFCAYQIFIHEKCKQFHNLQFTQTRLPPALP